MSAPCWSLCVTVPLSSYQHMLYSLSQEPHEYEEKSKKCFHVTCTQRESLSGLPQLSQTLMKPELNLVYPTDCKSVIKL